MCGRYAITCDADELVEAFGVPPLAFEHRPRYNVAPGQDAPVLARDRHGTRIGTMRWGLVPAGAAAAGRGHVNARAETVADKPSFRESFRRRRCLVPASGFYEWARVGRSRVPSWFHPSRGGPITFAGIWDRWMSAEGPLYSFSILTTGANDDVREIHERMPVVVEARARGVWLDPDAPSDALGALLVPAPAGTLVGHEVSRRVNRTSEDDPGLIEPVG